MEYSANKGNTIIQITAGIGQGPTKLAAFDAALWGAGIANYNLIKLSSVIPPHSTVVLSASRGNGDGNFGSKLYVVIAERRESEIGREAWAGIGWVQAEDGRGLFVEHEGAQKDEVERLIKETIGGMLKYREEKYGDIHYKTVGILCKSEPVCAVAAAVYGVEGWELFE